MKAMSEKAWQTQVVGLFRLHGWRTYHTYDSRRSAPGFPDLVIVKEDRPVIFAELKTNRGKVSAAQLGWLSELRGARAAVHVWRPMDWDYVVTLAEA